MLNSISSACIVGSACPTPLYVDTTISMGYLHLCIAKAGHLETVDNIKASYLTQPNPT